MKTTKNITMTMNILIISHLLEVIPLKYLSSSVCAASTFSWVSVTFESILYNYTVELQIKDTTEINSIA